MGKHQYTNSVAEVKGDKEEIKINMLLPKAPLSLSYSKFTQQDQDTDCKPRSSANVLHLNHGDCEKSPLRAL